MVFFNLDSTFHQTVVKGLDNDKIATFCICFFCNITEKETFFMVASGFGD